MARFKLTSFAYAILIPVYTFAQMPRSERMQFHAAKAYSAAPASQASTVVLHGLDETFAQRSASWQQAGYTVHANLPLSWGNYLDYLTGTWNGTSHFDEIQLRADSSEIGHESGGYYFVPSASYRDYLKKKIESAIDAGAAAIRLEQPIYWSSAGYSDGFKREWESFYETPWEAPGQSTVAQFQAEQLKFELELRAVAELLAHVKSYAQSKGRTVKGYVSTLSGLQNAHEGKIAPQAELLYIPECDGVIGQVSANIPTTRYADVAQTRAFANAWFDFGLFAQAARGHEKELVFSLEAGNAKTWSERKKILQAQFVAALLYPECMRYEWQTPIEQIFRAAPRGAAMASMAGGENTARVSVNEAALQTLVLQNVLTQIPQTTPQFEAGERGLGVLLSDALMLQRATPEANERELSSFYAIALPLLHHGIPVQPLVMENLSRPGYLTGYKTLFLSYRAMKPQQPKWHERLATWVKTGGTLIFIDDDKDAFNRAPGWWREPSYNLARPAEHLFQTLGLNNGANLGRNKAGMGVLIYISANPAQFAFNTTGPDTVMALLAAAMPHGRTPKQQNYFKLQRGPYVAAVAFAETTTSTALTLQGDWLDLFEPSLPRLSAKTIAPGEATLLYDVSRCDSTRAHVLVSAARLTDEQFEGARYAFRAHGPAQQLMRLVVAWPFAPAPVVATFGENAVPVQAKFENKLLWLEFEQQEGPMQIVIGE